MLHEVLLALSGHPSPLFEGGADGFPALTPAEHSLLHRLEHIATLHSSIRAQCLALAKTHPSAVCKATVNRVLHVHLRQFQQLILDVESQALSKDASRVGAYNIVPLAGIVSTFDPWARCLEWLWEVVTFIQPVQSTHDAPAAASCHGSSLLTKLRRDSKTGYPDLQVMALDVLASAERAWLRQLMLWFLQPHQLPNTEADLFLGLEQSAHDLQARTVIHAGKLPHFVSEDAATSIVFVGKTLRYLSSDWSDVDLKSPAAANSRLSSLETSKKFQPLAELQSPISSSQFSSAVAQVRAALSMRIVDGLLPIRHIVQTVALMRQFFLLGKPSFSEALILEADKLLMARKARIKNTPLALGSSLAGIMMKEGEVNTVLSKALVSLSPYISKGESVDTDLEWARENLYLTIDAPSSTHGQDKPDFYPDIHHAALFHDFLLSTPAKLDLTLRPPIDLFLSAQDVRVYSSIHSYVMSIQRTYAHLVELWRQTPSRKDHPAPAGPPRSNKAGMMRMLHEKRLKQADRMRSMRSTWSTASSAVFLLTELGTYMVSEVIGESWDTFSKWFTDGQGLAAEVQRPGSANSDADADDEALFDSASAPKPREGVNGRLPQDPEVLSEAHRLYLKALVQSLLLGEQAYVKALQTLLKHAEHFTAVIARLLHVQHNLDLQAEGVVYGGSHNYEQEEHEVYQEVLAAGGTLQRDCKFVIDQLKAIDARRAERGPVRDTLLEAATGFEPWKGYGVDRLLLRLVSSNIGNTAFDEKPILSEDE